MCPDLVLRVAQWFPGHCKINYCIFGVVLNRSVLREHVPLLSTFMSTHCSLYMRVGQKAILHDTYTIFFNKITHIYSREICHWAVFICFEHWRRILGASYLKDDYGMAAVVGIEYLFLWDDKCLSCGGNYVEKKWDSSVIISELFLLKLQTKNVKMCHPNLQYLLEYKTISFP